MSSNYLDDISLQTRTAVSYTLVSLQVTPYKVAMHWSHTKQTLVILINLLEFFIALIVYTSMY